jgi:hypothetical protein
MGDYFFRNLVEKARAGNSGTVEYRWLNVVDNKVEAKIAHFRRIGDTIIVVGHYVPRLPCHNFPPDAGRLLLRPAVIARA